MPTKIKPILDLDFSQRTEDGKVKDVSGNGYHGTIVGATPCEDQWGNPNSALDISADGYNISLPNRVFTNEAFSFFIVFNNRSTSYWRDLISLGVSKTRLEYDGLGQFMIYSGMVSSTQRIEAPHENKWVCLTITYDSSMVDAYIDNNHIYSQTSSGIVSESDNIYLGGRDLNFASMRVKISKFVGYNKKLTPTQVKHISAQMMRKIGRS